MINSRSKGAAGERELAKILSEELNIKVNRKLDQAREGGDDIQIGKYRIEVKRREKLQPDKWVEQVEQCTDVGEIGVVAYRRNGKPWRWIVPHEWMIEKLRDDIDDK
jgi:Holliday junction resolvase